MGMHENNPIQPVNAFSNAVDPRKLYPAHFDHLMRNLYHSGQQPERWRVLDAAEVRLDEDGIEVEFTLVQHGFFLSFGAPFVVIFLPAWAQNLIGVALFLLIFVAPIAAAAWATYGDGKK